MPRYRYRPGDPNDPIRMEEMSWWRIPAWIAAGVVVVGGGVYGYFNFAHHDTHPVAITKKAPKKSSVTTKATGPVTPPNYVPKTAPAAGQVFQTMASINNKYRAWGDQQIARAVPAIPSSGPGAGTLTPAILNSPLTLKQWPGPKVPLSLQAAGVTLTPGTPANGSIVGLTPQDVATSLKANQSWWPTLTPTELMGAYQTAAKYIMAAEGNNPTSLFQYVDPYAHNGSMNQGIISNWATGNIAGDFTAPASQGGMLPLRQVNYLNWVSYSMNPTNFFDDVSKLVLISPGTQSPHGHVLITNVGITGLTDHIIGTDLVHGKLVIGQYTVQVGSVALALLQDGSHTQWFVTGASGISSTNIPSTTYWTAP